MCSPYREISRLIEIGQAAFDETLCATFAAKEAINCCTYMNRIKAYRIKPTKPYYMEQCTIRIRRSEKTVSR